MKVRRKRRPRDGSMRPEYDFTGGVRGMYAERFARGSNVVVLAPDVAARFRTAEEVNEALRAYLPRVAPRRRPRTKRRSARS